jgi:hypothetical protein
MARQYMLIGALVHFAAADWTIGDIGVDHSGKIYLALS